MGESYTLDGATFVFPKLAYEEGEKYDVNVEINNPNISEQDSKQKIPIIYSDLSPLEILDADIIWNNGHHDVNLTLSKDVDINGSYRILADDKQIGKDYSFNSTSFTLADLALEIGKGYTLEFDVNGTKYQENFTPVDHYAPEVDTAINYENKIPMYTALTKDTDIKDGKVKVEITKIGEPSFFINDSLPINELVNLMEEYNLLEGRYNVKTIASDGTYTVVSTDSAIVPDLVPPVFDLETFAEEYSVSFEINVDGPSQDNKAELLSNGEVVAIKENIVPGELYSFNDLNSGKPYFIRVTGSDQDSNIGSITKEVSTKPDTTFPGLFVNSNVHYGAENTNTVTLAGKRTEPADGSIRVYSNEDLIKEINLAQGLSFEDLILENLKAGKYSITGTVTDRSGNTTEHKSEFTVYDLHAMFVTGPDLQIPHTDDNISTLKSMGYEVTRLDQPSVDQLLEAGQEFMNKTGPYSHVAYFVLGHMGADADGTYVLSLNSNPNGSHNRVDASIILNLLKNDDYFASNTIWGSCFAGAVLDINELVKNILIIPSTADESSRISWANVMIREAERGLTVRETMTKLRIGAINIGQTLNAVGTDPYGIRAFEYHQDTDSFMPNYSMADSPIIVTNKYLNENNKLIFWE